MLIEQRHRNVLQIVTNSNPHNWPKGDESDFCAFLAYFRFDDRYEAINYGNNLLKNGWAIDFEIREAKRFDSGFEIKVRGLSESNLETLVREFEAQDWMNAVFFDGPALENAYQIERDRSDLEADHFDSSWAG